MERVYLGFFCICVFLCTVVVFLVFLVYVFTVNTVLFAALDAK